MHKLFAKYIAGNCSVEEYEKVKDFIRKPENDFYLNGLLRSAWKKRLQSKPEVQPNIQLLHSIHHQIALNEPVQIRRIRFYQRLSAVAAFLLIGLILAGLFFPQIREPIVTTRNISVPYGGKTHFTLPDGSNVWINSGSTFNYPDRFSNERIVELQGEAYFDVAHNSSPFIVKTSYGEVEVLGTEFNIKAYEDESFETTLVNGAIKFTNKFGKQAELVPGTQVVFDSEKFRKRSVETDLFTSWKDGQLIFRDTPLYIMIPRLERWYNVDIELKLKEESIKDLKFTATIEFESFSEVLELIRVTTPIEYSFDKDTRILSINSP
jgi:ferric-dicitrate binding protein FerR (iron transport regulator)